MSLRPTDPVTAIRRRAMILAWGPTGLALLAVTLLGVCAWRATGAGVAPEKSVLTKAWRPAPRLTGMTITGELFRLERYLHRHAVRVVWIPDVEAVETARIVSQLLIDYHSQGVGSAEKWILVTPRLPQELRSTTLNAITWHERCLLVCDPASDWWRALTPEPLEPATVVALRINRLGQLPLQNAAVVFERIPALKTDASMPLNGRESN